MLHQLSDKEVLDYFLPQIVQIRKRLEETMDPPDSEFSFSDLFRGRSFEETRVIRNPTKYHPNPACFNVAMCRTGSMFLFEEWGDGVCGYLNVYWGNPHGEVKYAGNLFSQSDRKMKQQLFEEERRRRGYSPI